MKTISTNQTILNQLIEVETIELITADIIGLIEPGAIDIEPSHKTEITHARQSHDTPTEYKAELLHSPDMPLIEVQTPDISNIPNEKIPLPQ